MKLTTLNALVAAVEEGSLRGAARMVGASQPALTKMIRGLELELGARAAAHVTRRVAHTPGQGAVRTRREGET